MSKSKENAKFVSEYRDARVVGFGHNILLKQGVETHIPDMLHGEALKQGCHPVDKNFKLAKEPATPKAKVEEDPNKRVSDIKKAIRVMIAENKGDQWTASGKPKIAVVSKMVGYRVYEPEVQSSWDDLRPEAGKIHEEAATA